VFHSPCSTIGELTSKVSQLEADSSAVDGLRDGIKGIDEAINKASCSPHVCSRKGRPCCHLC